jgi:xylulokinase
MKAVAAVDIGTTHSKGCLVDAFGNVVSSFSVNTPAPLFVENHGVEHDALSHWWTPFCQVLQQLVRAASEARFELTGVFVSGVWATFLVTDASMRPLRNALLYNDPRAAKRKLGEETEPADCVEGFEWGPRFEWLRGEQLDIWQAAKKVFTTHSYIVGRLTGRYVLDYHTALCLGSLYDARSGTWSSAAINRLGIEHINLPEILRPGAVAGLMTQEIKDQFGLGDESIAVAVGVGDTFVSLLSAGICNPGDTVLYGGTVGHLIRLKEDHRASIISFNRGRDEERITWLGLFPNMGAQVEWCAHLAGGQNSNSWSVLERKLSAARRSLTPTSLDRELFFLNSVDDTTSPAILRRNQGVLTGLKAETTMDAILSAVAEYFGFAVRDAIEDNKLREADYNGQLLLGGGVFRTQSLVHTIANILGVPCLILDDSESAIGGALIIGDELGLFNMDLVQSTRRAAGRVTPADKAMRDYYMAKFTEFLSVRNKMRRGQFYVY